MADGLIARSRHRIGPFHLHRPSSLAEALDLLPTAAPIAGGVEWVEVMKRGGTPAALQDITKLPDLATIRQEGEWVRLGAAVTHRQLLIDPIVEGAVGGFRHVWREIGNPRIRAQGTLGGNLAASNPVYDLLPVLLALEAQVEVADASGTQYLPIQALAQRPRHSLILAVRVRAGAQLVFDRSLRPVIGIAAVRRESSIQAAIVWAQAEVRAAPLDDPADWCDQLPHWVDDAHGTAIYRAAVAPVLAARARARLLLPVGAA
ncbi:MAG: FAD binding domain-containing protein [Alphaproteobacteria bacterium]|nr:FAD binding domain-containing protein [Alphaproteobacteria bacterium]